jgi:aminopeptidase YwaD
MAALLSLGFQAPLTEPLGHVGPQVAPGTTATARFVKPVYEAYNAKAAMDSVAFVDGFYRAPGNEGYNACLDHVSARLSKAGYGKLEGFELEEILTPMKSPAWTPISGSLGVTLSDGQVVVLHAFDGPAQTDRVMLPIYSPNADVEGKPVFRAEDVVAGSILVSEDPLSGRSLKRFAKQGALAVISCSNADFTVDSNGGDEHLDAIQFRSMSPSTRLPVAQISKRSLMRLQELAAQDPALRLTFQAEVKLEVDVQIRTLVARVIGKTRPDEAVCVVAHVQEPGAGDNASGVGGICQGAIDVAELIRGQQLSVPSRTLVFVFGDEMRQSAVWLEHNERKVIAGLSADMLGQSKSRTGARCLLERSPDPGALDTILPDKHTPWGAGRVREEDLSPNGLALIARHAMIDVSKHVGGWLTSENPWEGGSDHDIFLRNGIPGILVWHFTDFTYHTGLDRMDRLDGEELRRTASVVLATALGVADLRSSDLHRLRASNDLELDLRVAAALEVSRPDVAKRWREWCHGVELWLGASVVDPEQQESAREE